MPNVTNGPSGRVPGVTESPSGSVPDVTVSPSGREPGVTVSPSGGVPEVTVDRERRSWFDSVHNETQGHMDLHATLRELQRKGLTWPRMSRDVVGWAATCALCQEYRLGGKEILAVPSPIATFQVFEEFGIDFIGPSPRTMWETRTYAIACVRRLTTVNCSQWKRRLRSSRRTAY